MKRATVAVAVAGLLACGVDGPAVPAPDLRVSPGDFELSYGRSAVIGGTGIRLTFRAVDDSRCPTNALILCVFEGTGVAYLDALVGSVEMTLALHTNPAGGPNSTALGGYRLELLELLPVPETVDPIPAESYRARLRVTIAPD
jgi:hypothetical protein